MEITIFSTNLKRTLRKITPLIVLVSFVFLLFWVSGAEATTLKDDVFKPLGNVSIPTIIGRVISALLGISGVLALLMFIYGGVTWMTAQGNSEKANKAKNIIIWSVLGLVMIFTSYAIVGLVVGLLGQS